MAITRGSNRNQNEDKGDNQNNDDSSSSYFLQTVVLNDWWLIKATAEDSGKKERLAIAGFTSREQGALRVFSSAAIAKRYDAFTLETSDGITVILQGFINRTRTTENGFSSEVFNHFLFGFPPHWEEFSNVCLGNVDSSAVDLQSTPDIDKLRTDADVEGTKASSPISTPGKQNSVSQDDRNTDGGIDCSQIVPENLDVHVSKGDLDNDAATVPSSFLEESNNGMCSILLNDNLALHSGNHIQSCVNSNKVGSTNGLDDLGTRDKSKHKIEGMGSPGVSALGGCLVQKTSTMENLNASSHDQRVANKTSCNNASKNLASSSSHCTQNVVNANETGSFNRIDNSCSSKKSKRTAGKTKAKRSHTQKALKSCSLPKASTVDNLSASNLDQNCLNKPRSSTNKRKECEGNEDASQSGTINCSAVLLQDADAALRCIKDAVTSDVLMFKTSTSEDSNVFKQSVNNAEDARTFSALRSVGELNAITSPTRKNGIVNATPRKPESGNNTYLLRSLKSNCKQKDVSGCSAKCTNKEFISEAEDHQHGGKPERPLTTPRSPIKVDLAGAMIRSARRLINLEENVKMKEKNKLKKGGSSRKITRRKIIFDAQGSPITAEREEKTHIKSPDSLSCKRSRSGRLLLPPLDFWRNQIPVYDADRNVTGIQEEIHPVKSCKGSLSEPQKRRI